MWRDFSLTSSDRVRFADICGANHDLFFVCDHLVPARDDHTSLRATTRRSIDFPDCRIGTDARIKAAR
jgi:hypothetical protein